MYNSCTECRGSGEAICMDCLQIQASDLEERHNAKIADLEKQLAHKDKVIEQYATRCKANGVYIGDIVLAEAKAREVK